MEVRLASIEDIDDIVKVHLSAFPGFFLTDLGESFLKLYYKSVLKSDDGILLSCIKDNRIIGFCAACKQSAGFNTRLIKNDILKYVSIGLKLFITNPKAIIRLIRNLTKKGDTTDNGEYSELLSIGVSREIQSKGAGQALMSFLETILRDLNIRQLSLTTDFEDNAKTLNFYSKNGFIKLYEFITYPNRKMYRLIKDI